MDANSDSHLKKINIDNNFLQVKSSKKESRGSRRIKKDTISQLNPTNVKELLLQKLKQYKKEKSRKARDSSSKSVSQMIHPHNESSSIPLTVGFANKSKSVNKCPIIAPTMNRDYGRYESNLPPIFSSNTNNLLNNNDNEPEYGNLKNGKKPTYKQYQRNKTMKNRDNSLHVKVDVDVKKKFKLGRNVTQKSVGVFIKGDGSRRKINDEKIDIQRTPIKTVKNYLKTQNLIKYGSDAPNELLREIYSSSKLCGDVFNTSGKSLIHNYMNDDK